MGALTAAQFFRSAVRWPHANPPPLATATTPDASPPGGRRDSRAWGPAKPPHPWSCTRLPPCSWTLHSRPTTWTSQVTASSRVRLHPAMPGAVSVGSRWLRAAPMRCDCLSSHLQRLTVWHAECSLPCSLACVLMRRPCRHAVGIPCPGISEIPDRSPACRVAQSAILLGLNVLCTCQAETATCLTGAQSPWSGRGFEAGGSPDGGVSRVHARGGGSILRSASGDEEAGFAAGTARGGAWPAHLIRGARALRPDHSWQRRNRHAAARPSGCAFPPSPTASRAPSPRLPWAASHVPPRISPRQCPPCEATTSPREPAAQSRRISRTRRKNPYRLFIFRVGAGGSSQPMSSGATLPQASMSQVLSLSVCRTPLKDPAFLSHSLCACSRDM
jgi:hypothetical protein